MATTQTATAPAKAKGNGKPQAMPAWYDVFNARINAAKGTLGTPPTPDMYRVALTLGPAGKGKRPGVEALWVAMTLRSEGATIAQYTAAGECRTANNWLQYLNDEGARHVYKQVHVTNVGGVRFTRLTAKGVAHCVAAGMAKGSLERLAKPVDTAKVTKAKAPAKVTAAPAKPKGAAKPAGKPIQAPASKPAPAAPQAPQAAPAKPHPVLTEAGPKMPQPAQGDGK